VQAAFNAQSSQLLNTAGLSLIPSAQTHDTTAYQIGVAVGNKGSLGLVTGSTSRKHAWEFRTYWQHIEQYALDPNLVDSDFFEGRLNMEGVYTALAYGFNENIIATARYGYARRINGKLGTGGSNQDIPQMNPIEYYNLLQLDVTCKF
jgi:Putative porin